MTETVFHGRQARQIENDRIRVSVTEEGGHIAEILDKATGVNPLWIPPWPSIEPSTWSAASHPIYGDNAESQLLAGIMGHNLCLDLFGAPSDDEAKAGVRVHAEAGIVPWRFEPVAGGGIECGCVLPASELRFRRTIRLDERRLRIHETVENLSKLDRPIAWTEHVTLGPPFLERGQTAFRLPGTKSRDIAESGDFEWPWYGKRDLRVFTGAESYAGYTTHLLDPAQERSYFFAWSPAAKVALGYFWTRADFPWMGIWEENHDRAHTPWLKRAMTRGMEFGVSPFPEPRRKMIERGSMFGEAGYRWIGGRSAISVEYWAAIAPAERIPESAAEFEALL